MIPNGASDVGLGKVSYRHDNVSVQRRGMAADNPFPVHPPGLTTPFLNE